MKLTNSPQRLYKRSTALLRTDPIGVRHGLVSLLIGTLAGLVAGVILGSVTNRLVALPGLIVLVPAAVGLRGNIYGALASRLNTIAQLGEYRFSVKRATTVGSNIYASILLSLSASMLLAVVAKLVSESFGVANPISLLEFFLIAIGGGIIPTIVVLACTIFLSRLCVKREWDLDNVAAPLITATGDCVTIPSLLLMSLFISNRLFVVVAGMITFAVAAYCLIVGLWAHIESVKRIVRESLPVLIVGGSISILAGLAIQSKISSFSKYPILLVLLPPLLSINGAIGSILSARVATKLHLGFVRADKFNFGSVSEDLTVSYLLTVPIFFILGVFCSIYSRIGHLAGPGYFYIILISLTAGFIATTLSNCVGYLSATLTYRFGFDPDNFAVPSVTSISDLIGAVVLMAIISVLPI
jgi:mgtE-like transporter